MKKYVYQIDKEVYYCNPRKNKKCKKTGCFLCGSGECRITLDKKYRARGIRLLAMRIIFGKENEEWQR